MPLVYFGILWAGLNISAGVLSINAHLFYKRNDHKILMQISIAMLILFIMLGVNVTPFGLIFIAFIYMLRGVVTPILRNEINESTTSNKRATVLSIRSFVIRISFAIFAPILGFLADTYCLSISFYFLTIVVGFFSLLSVYKLRKLD